MRLTTSALWAAVVLEFLVDGEPDGVMRIGRIASAADMALGELGTCDRIMQARRGRAHSRASKF
jgi:hypothetical protein